MPPEYGVDRFIDEDNEETLLKILPSGSCGITVTKDKIATFRCEGIVVDNDNEPAPENVLNSKDVIYATETLSFGFQGIRPLYQSGKLTIGKKKLKIVSNIRVHHM